MTAIELAEKLDDYAPSDKGYMLNDAAAMLRKQREAIKQLREALVYASTYVQEDEAERGRTYMTGRVVRATLAATEAMT